MKKLFTVLGFSWICLFASGSGIRTPFSCEDDVSVLQSHYSICFGDAIEAGVSTDLSLAISWRVAPQTGVSKGSGLGKTTGNLVFSQPGTYQITFNIPAHGDHPAKTETVTVEVSSAKLIFDLEHPVFSKQLKTGDASGIVMTVPVMVKTYDGKAYNYTMREVQTTGVANVSSHLKNDKAVLKDGLNELSFELSGAVPTKGNIQFRVYDAKGEAQFFTYSITN
ncbi:MAG: hypothetical protein K0S23_747 [Fluviicola sp.]|jgi:hypothetical protein|uniref:hypothetical protein n=1 Tax=Fluviicola sp. TaxID=1917219 RepID=UPI002628A044|nr:hypothetical protein [Fluviicola sp.]MDF3026440.1 hypothetical protein [Fluviicola sp.]